MSMNIHVLRAGSPHSGLYFLTPSSLDFFSPTFQKRFQLPSK